MSHSRAILGRQNEGRAEQYLSDRGFRLIERSCRARFGEIDLVMQDGETIVFVEVRSRSANSFGRPEESVNYRKQAKICRVAAGFLQTHKLDGVSVRFDVVAITGTDVEYFPNAFYASGFTL